MELQGGCGKNYLNGENEIVKIDLTDEILKKRRNNRDLITAAHNNAKSQLKSKTSEEISKATGGFGIPVLNGHFKN